MAPFVLGRTATIERRFTSADVEAYTRLVGHTPERGEVPEPLIDALFSCLLGMHVPGLGTNYLKQESEFRTAARIDEALSVRVTITRYRSDKHLVDVATHCSGADGRLISAGRALVYVADVVS